MKITMARALNIKDLYPKLTGKVLPLKTTYKITKLFNTLEEETKFYSTELNKIIKAYAEKDEEGNLIPEGENGIKIQKDKVDEAQTKINELWELEIEIPDYKFSIEELEDVGLTVGEFNLFLPLIVD